MQKKWNKFFDSHGRFYMLPHEDITKFINLCKKHKLSKILDLGCGSGRHVVKLAEEGFDVFGIDKSPSAAALAEKWLHQKNLEAEVFVADFDDKQKDFEDESFDAVIAVNTLEYGESGEFNSNLMQIYRLLKKDGLIFIVYRTEQSQLKHPDVPVQFMDEEKFRKTVKRHFKIAELYKDQAYNFVVFAKKA
ncbi:methyltransferase domain-containing protein [Candidatus Dojkabacteria bacterium]|nr:methyltransferase domain-containing protein [Candidatus Dojkabacteria bacterium]